MCTGAARLRMSTGIAALCGVVVSAHALTGPSSSASPYVVRARPGVVTKSILTVGDAVGGYRLAGIPDGLGAFDNHDGTFTVLVNHEIRDTLGVPRAHGAAGAFVSRWIIRKGGSDRHAWQRPDTAGRDLERHDSVVECAGEGRAHVAVLFGGSAAGLRLLRRADRTRVSRPNIHERRRERGRGSRLRPPDGRHQL